MEMEKGMPAGCHGCGGITIPISLCTGTTRAAARAIGKWSLTSLQQRLVKTGGRLIRHARYCWLLLAEGHLTRRLFAGILRKIAAVPSPAG
jgi:uncharacterized membrane protein YoaK (UPF0700 family)